MRLACAVLLLGFAGCASVPVRSPEPTQPDMDGVLRLIGRFSTAHACPYGDGRYALTAAHVIDPRPFDLSVPAFAVRWSDGNGHSGWPTTRTRRRRRCLPTWSRGASCGPSRTT